MFAFLVKRLIYNLLDFNVLCADLFKMKVTEIAQHARAVLDLEESTSIEKYPSIRPLLNFFLGPLTATDSVTAHLGNDDMETLERNTNDLEGLLTTAREVEKDSFSPQLVRGEYPSMFRKFAFLQTAAMKDGIKWTQQNYYRLSLEN
ncbi:hypothetical protein AMTRI_Chr02g217050 [Amborella trichopoda]